LTDGSHIHLKLQPLKGAPFVIPYADDVAEFFFRTNLSYRYDEWAATDTNRNRITAGDITAINQTMAARSSAKHWDKFTTAKSDLASLAALDTRWDLFEMTDEAWKSNDMETALAKVFESVMGPYRGAAVVTKVLHIKRPKLIPVCDSVVAATMGTALDNSSDPWSVGRFVVHLRAQGRENLDSLSAIQERLRVIGFDRSLVRILDSILWTSGLREGPYAVFRDWLTRVHGEETQGGSS